MNADYADTVIELMLYLRFLLPYRVYLRANYLTIAATRNGPPLSPPIFIGIAITKQRPD